MPRIEDGTFIIGMEETAYHYWNSGKSIFETLLELNTPLNILKNYCVNELLLGHDCPQCHIWIKIKKKCLLSAQ